MRHGLASYSVENVAVDAVKRLFRRLKECHPDGFDYVELKAERLGAACERTRLVGGAPALVARLKALPALKAPQLRTMRQAFEAAGVAVPAEATHVRSGSGRYKPHGGGSAFALRRIATERATTLVASRALVFATADGTTVRQLAPHEAAALMGLPAAMALFRTRSVTRQRCWATASRRTRRGPSSRRRARRSPRRARGQRAGAGPTVTTT